MLALVKDLTELVLIIYKHSSFKVGILYKKS